METNSHLTNHQNGSVSKEENRKQLLNRIECIAIFLDKASQKSAENHEATMKLFNKMDFTKITSKNEISKKPTKKEENLNNIGPKPHESPSRVSFCIVFL